MTAARLFALVALTLPLLIVSQGGFGYHQSGADWDGACIEDQRQSPIDITVPEGVDGADSKQLLLFYPFVNAWTERLSLTHTGTTLQVDAKKGNLGYMWRGNRKFNVKEFHFRAPSEHSIRGEQFPLELQIVHQRDGAKGETDTVIISVLFRMSKEAPSNPWLDEQLQWGHLPFSKGRRTMMTGLFQLGAGIDGLQQGYFSYTGSTTAPPCTTGVTWLVLEAIQEVAQRQVMLINNIFLNNPSFAQYHGNNRALQSLNGRTVTLHNHKQIGDGDMHGYQYNQNAVDPENLAPPKPISAPPSSAPTIANGTKTADLERVLPSSLPELYADAELWTGYCTTGRLQSPVDIRLGTGSPHGDYEMKVQYAEALGRTRNTGNAIQIEGKFGLIQIDGNNYNISDITFHTPAEHTIDGRQSAMEMQIIHTRSVGIAQSAASDIAVLSVLFHEDDREESRFLDTLKLDELPVGGGLRGPETLVNLNLLEGLGGGYYSYAGSLSSPPCTEGVKRFVLRTFQEASSKQLKRFRVIFSGNSRGVQPRNQRGIVAHNIRFHTEILPLPRTPLPLASLTE